MPNIIHGDSLKVLPTLKPESFDALIADPPYASGGRTASEKGRSTSNKYQQTGTIKKYPGGNFVNDNLDQRSWIRWCSEWLSECFRLTRPGGYALVFIDWRQLPAMTDAFQMSCWQWRGIIAWDKTECSRAPHKGYFRHQCEYVVWEPREHAKQQRTRGHSPEHIGTESIRPRNSTSRASRCNS